MGNNVKIKIYFGDGTERAATVTPGAVALIKRCAASLPFIFEGTGFNPLDPLAENIVAVSRADHDLIHTANPAVRKADFRLGQMDMKESIVHMLLDAELNAPDELRAGLLCAADKVLSMEVPDADA